MEVIKRMLKLVRPSMPDHPAADVSAGREKLRCALEGVKQAEQRLEDAKAQTERVLNVINGAEPLEEEANRAAEAAAEATRKWAVSGAPKDVPAGDQILLDRAVGAQRRLMEARMMTTGAKAALPGLEQAERTANSAVSEAREQVAKAIASVMVATLSPHIVELREARAAYYQSLKEVAAVGHLWSPEVRWRHKYMSSSHYEAIIQHLRELEIRIPSDKELSDRVGEWENFARRLRSDPDAVMSDGIDGATQC
jgi:hypothetical protein